ncbi:hypothetical protein C8Q78DRAFT_529723 [Trametes maxima]|nr:hypothetical protein C8Q78DRAFT_529723 [Trametes maxima]
MRCGGGVSRWARRMPARQRCRIVQLICITGVAVALSSGSWAEWRDAGIVSRRPKAGRWLESPPTEITSAGPGLSRQSGQSRWCGQSGRTASESGRRGREKVAEALRRRDATVWNSPRAEPCFETKRPTSRDLEMRGTVGAAGRDEGSDGIDGGRQP